MPTYEGRLEFTWTNKPLRLLAHEDGSYEWVSPFDYRVAEVRLLHDAGAVGEVHGACAVGCGGAGSRQSALFGGRDRRCLPSEFGGDRQQPESRSTLKDAIVADQRDLVVRCRGGNPQIVRVDFLGESVSLPETPQTKIGACPRELIVAGRNHRAGDPLLELLESRLAPVSFARPKVQLRDGLDGNQYLATNEQRSIPLSEWSAPRCEPSAKDASVNDDRAIASDRVHSSMA